MSAFVKAAGSFKQRFFLLLFFKFIVITGEPIVDLPPFLLSQESTGGAI